MSKLNSRFSHLRINIGNEELRNGDNKIKKIPSRDSNTFRIQSPKNLNTFTNRQIQVVYTSPPTAKKDNNNFTIKTNYTINNNANSFNKTSNPGYIHTTASKNDRNDSSIKLGKSNLYSIIKSNSKNKTNNENNLNINYTNTLGNRGNVNYIPINKAYSSSREKPYTLMNSINNQNNLNNYIKKNSENVNSTGNLNLNKYTTGNNISISKENLNYINNIANNLSVKNHNVKNININYLDDLNQRALEIKKSINYKNKTR